MNGVDYLIGTVSSYLLLLAMIAAAVWLEDDTE